MASLGQGKRGLDGHHAKLASFQQTRDRGAFVDDEVGGLAGEEDVFGVKDAEGHVVGIGTVRDIGGDETTSRDLRTRR